MAAALEDTAPFKTVLGFGTLLDQNGEEMHKSKGNSIPFDEAADIVGADTMRWLFANHAPEQNLRFPRIPTEEEAGRRAAQGQPPRLSDLWMQARTPLDKLWNVYSFFVTYANIDEFNPTTRIAAGQRAQRPGSLGALRAAGDDRRRSRTGLVAFDAQARLHGHRRLIENLSNWYVRRSRRRFWKSEEDADKVAAYLTLYECLVTVDQAAGAVHAVPGGVALPESRARRWIPTRRRVCISATGRWPMLSLISPALARRNGAGHAAGQPGPRRPREGADSRTPAALRTLCARRAAGRARDAGSGWRDQVLDELNVKRLELLPPESDMLVYTVQPQMAVLGPKHGRCCRRCWRRCDPAIMQAKARSAARYGRLLLEVEGQPSSSGRMRSRSRPARARAMSPPKSTAMSRCSKRSSRRSCWPRVWFAT